MTTSWEVGALDLRVAQRLTTLAAESSPELVAAVALAVAAPRGGHVCVDLALVDGPVVGPGDVCLLPSTDDAVARAAAWVTTLIGSQLARPSWDAERVAPLVVDGTRLYLDRYWRYEDRLLHALVVRSAPAGAPADLDALRRVLDVAAPHDADGPAVDRQRLAVANALLRPLSVLSGGPGTGKTHTVVSLLVAQVLLAEARGMPTPRLAIAAPTGKAAARMEQAISQAVRARGLQHVVVDVIGELRGQTVHRLLGTQRWAPTRFRHNARNPLPYDVVVVDEASMVPLSMMAKLVDAVPDDATLVLVGDRNQLTSVEAGAVLGDVCGPRPAPGASSMRLSAGWAATLAELTGAPLSDEADVMPEPGVWDGIVQLERFRRFGVDSGIGAVARAIQRVEHDAAEVLELCTGMRVEPGAPVDVYTDVRVLAPDAKHTLPQSLRPAITGALAGYLDAVFEGDAAAALTRIDAVRVLCAVRDGTLGVHTVGQTVERWVAAADPRLRITDEWYVGRPVLVTRNDYDLGLMNGDVGVTLDRAGTRVVAFQLADGTINEIPAIRVADCETVWAMTIHKSQGSQFTHAIVVLPARENDIVTRELVYTGVTRAAEMATIVAAPDRLAAAVARPVRRATGLRERLWR
jgi:exodeoxyribonuclease V alpha subunit